MIKAIVLDIDDTLIPRGSPTVVESAIRAIEICRKKGIKIIVATGRGYYLMQQDVKDRVRPDYYITVNGCCVNDSEGKVIKTYPMTPGHVEWLIDQCLDKGYTLGFKCSDSFQIYNNYEEFASRYSSPGISREMLIDATEKRDYHLTHGLPLGAYIYSPQAAAYQWKEQEKGLKFVRVSLKSDAVECFDINANKGNTLLWLLDSLGIKPLESIAFGDSQNDLEMMKVCGNSVAMGNSIEEVKAAADYVTSDIRNDGIWNALVHYRIIEG